MASESFTSYSVDNDKKFARALKHAGENVSNLTTPLNLIRNDFYKSQKAIFMLSGPGKYPDLQPETKKKKEFYIGSAYPILRFSGQLEKSVTDKNDMNAVNDILGKKTLLLGTLVEYGVYHQSDKPRRKAPNRAGPWIPQRKFFFIGPEAPSVATDEQMGRLKRWMAIMADYVTKAIAKENKG